MSSKYNFYYAGDNLTLDFFPKENRKISFHHYDRSWIDFWYFIVIIWSRIKWDNGIIEEGDWGCRRMLPVTPQLRRDQDAQLSWAFETHGFWRRDHAASRSFRLPYCNRVQMRLTGKQEADLSISNWICKRIDTHGSVRPQSQALQLVWAQGADVSAQGPLRAGMTVRTVRPRPSNDVGSLQFHELSTACLGKHWIRTDTLGPLAVAPHATVVSTSVSTRGRLFQIRTLWPRPQPALLLGACTVSSADTWAHSHVAGRLGEVLPHTDSFQHDEEREGRDGGTRATR